MTQDSPELQAFNETLGGQDPKTAASYLSIPGGFSSWLADLLGGFLFRMEVLTSLSVDHIPCRAQTDAEDLGDLWIAQTLAA